jgi:hypothetical protein
MKTKLAHYNKIILSKRMTFMLFSGLSIRVILFNRLFTMNKKYNIIITERQREKFTSIDGSYRYWRSDRGYHFYKGERRK